MTEDKDLQDLLSEAGISLDDISGPGGKDSEDDSVSGLPESIETIKGDMPGPDLEALRPVCTLAEQNYQNVLNVIKAIKAANNVLHRFHKGDPEIAQIDLDAGKTQFHKAKESYIQLGNQINEGISQIHIASKTYPEDLLAQGLYITYLAKLMASLEARNPLEPYVKRMADYYFNFDREDIILTEEEKRRDLTLEQKKQELLELAERDIGRLESRYQKRQLQIKLRAGERKGVIVRHLVRLSKVDPADIHTFIWIAQLLAGEYPKQRDQNKRLEMRDDILTYCQRAFTLIDDFLNLQGIQNLSERDKRRSEYLKTITQIRKPLVET